MLHVDTKGPKPFSVAKVKRAMMPEYIRWSETLEKGDHRIQSPEMQEAVRAEIVDLIKQGTFKLVVFPEGHDKTVVPSRFVCVIKESTTDETKYKAWFVVAVYRDRKKYKVVHIASTLSHMSMRLLLALSLILGFEE